MADGQQELIWRKSRSCASNACVEVASDGAHFLVRDSGDPSGVPIAFEAEDWASFIGALKHDGEDLSGVER